MRGEHIAKLISLRRPADFDTSGLCCHPSERLTHVNANIGQMQAPRFFHHQLTSQSGKNLLIAGASMETGKTGRVELLQLSSP